jgi:DNA-binding transcriptional ArsR family regulator
MLQKYLNRKQLTSALEDLVNRLWSAWGALGIYADVKKEDMGLEDSFIALCIVGRFDSRLFDEALSIAITFSRYFSMNKLKYWSNYLDDASKQIFDCLLAVVIKISGEKRLSKLVSLEKGHDLTTPLFLNVNNDAIPYGRICDDLFIQYGFARNRFQLSKNIASLATLAADSPSLKAKLVFGVGVASDIITKLATMESYTASELARQTGYSKQAISKYLQNMEIAGMVSSESVREKKYYSILKSKSKFFSEFKISQRNFQWLIDFIKFGYYYHAFFKLPEGASPDLCELSFEEVKSEVAIKLPL